MSNVTELRISSLDTLAPIVESLAKLALDEANDLGYQVKPFETYRSPSRQNTLYAQGRTAAGKIVTKAKAWQSFHQYGSAIDVVFFIDGRWSWDEHLPWDKLAHVFENYNFTTLDFEKPHFELTGGYSWQQAYNLVKKGGMDAWYDALLKRYSFL